MSYEREELPDEGTTPTGLAEDADIDWTQKYPWWHDPDTAPEPWRFNYDHDPRDLGIQPPPGYIWRWTGDHWETESGSYPNQGPPQYLPPSNTPPPATTGTLPPVTTTTGSGPTWSPTSAPVPGAYPTGSFPFPTLTLPDYPGWERLERPPAFEFDEFDPGDPFVAPDPQSILDDPSYLWRFEEGLRPLRNSRAALGLSRTGKNMKEMMRYGQGFASNEYDRIYDRASDTYDRNLGTRFNTWNANRTNALDTYRTNWGVTTDVDDRNYQRSLDTYDRTVSNRRSEYDSRSRWAELQFGRDWDVYRYMNDDAFRRWQQEGNWNNNIATMPPEN